MILESLIQIISTALAYTLLITFAAALVFYTRYKLSIAKPAAQVEQDPFDVEILRQERRADREAQAQLAAEAPLTSNAAN